MIASAASRKVMPLGADRKRRRLSTRKDKMGWAVTHQYPPPVWPHTFTETAITILPLSEAVRTVHFLFFGLAPRTVPHCPVITSPTPHPRFTCYPRVTITMDRLTRTNRHAISRQWRTLVKDVELAVGVVFPFNSRSCEVLTTSDVILPELVSHKFGKWNGAG